MYTLLDHIDDYDTLKSLVRSSPNYHHVYVTSRSKFLSQVIRRHLGDVKVFSLWDLPPYTKTDGEEPKILECSFSGTNRSAAQKIMSRVLSPDWSAKLLLDSPWLRQPALRLDDCLAVLRHRGFISNDVIELDDNSLARRVIRFALTFHPYECLVIGRSEIAEDYTITVTRRKGDSHAGILVWQWAHNARERLPCF